MKIKTPKKLTVGLNLIAIALTLGGIVLSFRLDNNLEYRPYYVGIPLIIGILTLTILKVIFPVENIGQLTIDEKIIEISKDNSELKLSYSDIENIRLLIGGYEMALKKSWTFFSREFFPYEHGHNNKIIITTKQKFKYQSPFFLNNKSEEDKLISILKTASKDFNFNLKLG